MSDRRRLVLVATVTVILGGFAALPVTLARFTDAAPSTGAVTADTLAPPTGLAATSGATVTLTWTPTVDSYAAGYGVYRSATSGGSYSLISNVTPRTAATTTDSPANGIWYYVLRSTYQSWTSVVSNEASAIAGTPTSTAFMACTTQQSVTTNAGDNNGYEGTPARICVNDSSAATDTNSGTGGTQSCGTGAAPDTRKDQHRMWGFAFGLPGAVTAITGIRIRADLGMNNTTGTTAACAQLSWDGGTTWTSMQSATLTAAGETAYTFGTTSDRWGRTWTLGNLSTTNFRVRLINASTLTTKRFDLDYVAASVTYVP